MRTALVKHASRADLRSILVWTALLGVPAALASPAASALASTTGGASAKAAAATSEATVGGASSGGSAPAPQASKPTLATWFGPGFYGQKTACGQTMSPTLVGVASRTLACGTLVQVGYRGHRLTVPVLDRGPYGHIGAQWDLTAGAARALKIRETVRVTTEIVGSLPNGPTLGQPSEPSPTATPTTTPGADTAAVAASTGGVAAG
jgi:rare lipoprotein A (peptidoglycan hydrolase)